MTSDENRQIIIAIPTSNGDPPQTFVFTPEVLPDQLIPLVQKKHFKEEKSDYSYKKLLENLSEGRIVPLTSVSNLGGNCLDLNSCSSVKSPQQLTSSSQGDSSVAENVVSSIQTRISSQQNPIDHTASLLLTNSTNHPVSAAVTANRQHSGNTPATVLLQAASSINTNQSLSTILPCSASDSSGFLSTIQLSQNNSNLPTLTLNQPQNFIHCQSSNHANPNNTVLIPITLQNANQYSQQILVAAAAVSSTSSSTQNYTTSTTNSMLGTSSTPSLLSFMTTGSDNSALTTTAANSISSSSTLSKLISENMQHQSINLTKYSPTVSSSDSPTRNSSSSKLKTNFMHHQNGDESQKKKETRLLKNREAARECRRKKKEYVKCLEQRITHLEKQNKVLVDEINRMRELYSKRNLKQQAVPNLKQPQQQKLETTTTTTLYSNSPSEGVVGESNTEDEFTLTAAESAGASSAPSVSI